MAQSNHERIGKALELLNAGLRPFVEREMQGVYADKWLGAAQAGIREDRAPRNRWNLIANCPNLA